MFLFFSCIDVTNDVCVLLKKVETHAVMKLQTSPVLLPGPVLLTWGESPGACCDPASFLTVSTFCILICSVMKSLAVS